MNEVCGDSESQPPKCPVCASSEQVELKHKKFGHFIHRCRSCSLMFVHPQPSIEMIASIYDSEFFKRGNKYSGEESDANHPNRQNDAEKMQLVKRYRQSGKLLDVGCALGGFLRAARADGFDAEGAESSTWAAEYVKEQLGIDVFTDDLCTTSCALGPYDVITLWDVLEHLTDPVAMLGKLHEFLRPNGIIIISTGDAGSTWAKLSGRFWQLLTPPQHLFYFTRESLARMLTGVGFRVLDVVHPGKSTTFEFLAFKMRESLGFPGRLAYNAVRATGLQNRQIYVNMHDIMMCIAIKPS